MNKKVKVAAVGDNCIDVYPALGKAYPGGNPVNVAVYIKRLGGNASYTGAVGTDENGKLMKERLKEKGVDISHIKTLPGKTAVTHVEIVDGDRVLGEYEEGVLKEFRLEEEDISFLCTHDLVVTGIWGMIEKELPRIREQDIPTAFDFANKFDDAKVDLALPFVNYAFFSYDEEAKEDLKKVLLRWECKVQKEEQENIKEFMRCGLKHGPEVMIVTLGEQGSIAWDGKRFYKYGIVPCKVVDTMGAGDSFIAGFLYGMLNNLEIEQSMEIGAKSSSETIGYSGAW